MLRPRAASLCLVLSIAPAVLPLALTGCDSFLSQSGPRRGRVIDDAARRVPDSPPSQQGDYTLVPLDAGTVAALGGDDAVPRFGPAVTDVAASGGILGVGDVLAITVFEAAAGGLFIPSEPGTRTGNYVTLPQQQVGSDGRISVPFAGQIRAAGLNTSAVEREIDGRLAARALDPQALVTVVDRHAGSISVTGEVGSAAHFSLDPGGERVLGAIARAGGPRYPAYEVTVTLQRGGQTERALLSEVMTDPVQNIALRPGDGIYLAHTPRYFLVFGATGPGQSIGLVNRRFSFDDSRLTLADALAKAGGLEDDRANAQAIFVYRFVPPPPGTRTAADAPVVQAASGAPLTARPIGTGIGGVQATPTIYMLDLTKPDGYFRANQFRMHNADTLFVSNSPSTDLGKFLALVLPAAYSTSGFRSGFN